jgi:hypothetical protein
MTLTDSYNSRHHVLTANEFTPIKLVDPFLNFGRKPLVIVGELFRRAPDECRSGGALLGRDPLKSGFDLWRNWYFHSDNLVAF